MRGFAGVAVCSLSCLALACAHELGHRTSGEMPDPRSGIFAEKCTNCHNLDKVEAVQATKTREEMKEILRRHKDMECPAITEEDLQVFLRLYSM